ncbi:MAG TPA: UvrD-helicase domain-containing protein [Patescibacteria group bacterium]|nr:UvrD-helicase domain-containing protein [Patescibacteria group bacterium]
MENRDEILSENTTRKTHFTREQILAQGVDRHLAVTANAGSGKTAVLVERYVNLLMGGNDPRNIVAITFTRKAAAEMMVRVAKKLEEKLDKATTADELKLLKTVRERLTSARISTIHSFCSQLLKEFPIEAGVAPNFTEISESELYRIRRDAAMCVMEDWLEDDGEKGDSARLIFRALGRKKVEESLDKLLRNAEFLMTLRALYETHGDEQVMAVRDRMLSAAAIPHMNSVLKNLRKLCDVMNPALLKGKTAEHYDAAVLKLSTWPQYISPEEVFPIRELSQKIFGILETQKSFCTGEGTVSAAFKKAVEGGPIAEIDMELADSIKTFKNLEDVLKYAQEDSELLKLARILCQMAVEAQELVDADKAALNGLDFDDLQLKALALLQDEEIRRKLRKKIAYLMMDEFQDTNQLQYDIARSIVAALETAQSVDEPATNIFIVGDAKQSIYGFRSADVRVFEKARQDIMTANERDESERNLDEIPTLWSELFEKPSTEEKYGNVKLSASFRLLPQIAAFVNRICAHAMSHQQSDYDVQYEPLVYGAPPDRPQDMEGTITLLLARKFKKGDDDFDEIEPEQTLTESQLLASHIQKIVDSDNPLKIWDKDEKALRNLRYSDIAVLARNRSGFEELGAELRALDIPFVIHAGSGFFETPEVVDVYSYLSFLHNATDDIALAGVLRSPFFGVTDTELLSISHAAHNVSLWEKFGAHYEEGFKSNFKNYPPMCRRAYEILTDMIPLSARLPIPLLLRTILERSGWRGSIAGHQRQAQMEANIEKLLQYARDFENKGFKNLYDFVEELTLLKASSAKESEAAVISNADVVNIMTIHASKGLEFPVVAAFKMNKSGGHYDALYTNRELGLAFPVPVHFEEADARALVATPISFAARTQKENAERAEEKRLLYVALTRAREHLVVSGTISFKKDGTPDKPKGMLAMIFDGMNYSAADLQFNHDWSPESTDFLKTLRGENVVEEPIDYGVHVAITPEEFTLNRQRETPQIKLPQVLLNTLDGTIRNEFYSASQIMLYEKSEREYIHRYRLGFPAEDDEQMNGTLASVESGDDSILGSLAGTIIHEVLSNMTSWLDEDGVIDLGVLKEEIRIATGERVIGDELETRIIREAKAIAQSELVRRYAPHFAAAEREVMLHLPINEDFLVGAIDMLVPNDAGQWEVWDWKSNRVATPEEMDALADYYQLQMQVYAYFAAHMFQSQESFTARLLFTRKAGADAQEADWTRTFTWSRKEIKAFGIAIERSSAEICKRSYNIFKKTR